MRDYVDMRCVLILLVLVLAPVAAMAAEASERSGPVPRIGLTSTNEAPPITEPIGRPVGFVWIKPGTFMLGSPKMEAERGKNEGPQTQVTITRGFWMGRHEVTQAEFQLVMGGNRSQFKGDTLPMESVSWFNATNYCRKLSMRAQAAGHLPQGYWFRLPTEAEWEYACRAGKMSAFAFGSTLSSTKANFNGKYPYGGVPNGPNVDMTTPVGSYAPNAWGLYDMHGNVWEWCSDCYASYPGGEVIDPTSPSNGFKRVIRGGNWFLMGRYCRSADRMYDFPGSKNESLGFRVVLAEIK